LASTQVSRVGSDHRKSIHGNPAVLDIIVHHQLEDGGVKPRYIPLYPSVTVIL